MFVSPCKLCNNVVTVSPELWQYPVPRPQNCHDMAGEDGEVERENIETIIKWKENLQRREEEIEDEINDTFDQVL